MTPEIKIKKNIRNLWEAESEVVLKKIDETKTLLLRIITMKRDGGSICTSATVCVKEQKNGYYSHQHVVFEDYSVRWANEKATANEKNVLRIHQQALEHLPSQMEVIKSQYKLMETVDA